MRYFKESEFSCKCGKCNLGFNTMNEKLLIRLDTLRLLVGIPLVIISGIRCVDYNKSLKDAKPNSFHLTGSAVDLQAFDGSFKREIVENALRLGFTGIGVGENFIHLDVGDRKALWSY